MMLRHVRTLLTEPKWILSASEEVARLSSNPARDVADVLTESELKVLLRKGYPCEVIAREEPHMRGPVWYGNWIVAAFDDERTVERPLVSMRRKDGVDSDEAAREFKTANGLISFLHRLGFRSITLPMEQGSRAAHRLPADRPDSSDA